MIGRLEIFYTDPPGYEVHLFTIAPGAGFELPMVPDLDRPSGRIVRIKVSGPPLDLPPGGAVAAEPGPAVGG